MLTTQQPDIIGQLHPPDWLPNTKSGGLLRSNTHKHTNTQQPLCPTDCCAQTHTQTHTHTHTHNSHYIQQTAALKHTHKYTTATVSNRLLHSNTQTHNSQRTALPTLVAAIHQVRQATALGGLACAAQQPSVHGGGGILVHACRGPQGALPTCCCTQPCRVAWAQHSISPWPNCHICCP